MQVKWAKNKITEMATASNKLNDLVTCIICQEIFVNPVALSCLHSFCLHCVEGLQKQPKNKNKVECPLCRKFTDSSLVKKDFRTQNLVDIVLQNEDVTTECLSVCELCVKREVTSKCINCNKFMCSDCQQAHLAIPLCTDHIIKNLEVLVQEGTMQVQRILDKISNDKKDLDTKLNLILNKEKELAQIKGQAYVEIDNSEKEIIQKVKEYHQYLKRKVTDETDKSNLKLKKAKDETNEMKYHLEQTAALLVHMVAKSENSAIIASSLDLLKHVELNNGSLSSAGVSDTSITIKLQRKTSFDLSQNLQIKTKIIEGGEIVNESISNSKLDEKENILSLNKNMLKKGEGQFSYCDQVALLFKDMEVKVSEAKLKKKNSNSQSRNVGKKLDCATVMSDSREEPIISLEHLLTTQLIRKQDISLGRSDCPQNLSLIGNEVWCIYHNKIQVYDMTVNYLIGIKQHQMMQTARSVCKADNGDCFVATEQGLLVFGPTFAYQHIFPGKFIDVVCDGLIIYALEHNHGCILIFKNVVLPRWINHNPLEQCTWKIVATIKRIDSLSLVDTILVKGQHIFVCSYKGDCITVYDCSSGQVVSQTGSSGRGVGELWRPRLCCLDQDGRILVADFYNNRLQVFEPDSSRWLPVDIQGLNFPWDGVLHPEAGLMVLQQCNINHKIIQFMACPSQ